MGRASRRGAGSRRGRSRGVLVVSVASAIFVVLAGATTASAAIVPPSPPSIGQPVAAPSDPLLVRTLPLTPGNPGTFPVTQFQYGWNSDTTAPAPAGALQSCPVGTQPCQVSYAETRPGETWRLYARAVNSHRTTSAWSSVLVQTPSKPVLVAIGDSLTSGHHRDGPFSSTVCNDPAYGYPSYESAGLQSALPAAWQSAGAAGYYNVAFSGFSTTEMINGGVDACGASHPSSLASATQILAANKGSWNAIVATGGIDDTNWVTVVRSVVETYSYDPFYDQAECQADVAEWNGPSLMAQITANVKTIQAQLVAADPAANLTWVSYYNIANTGSPWLEYRWATPTFCEQPFQTAMDKLVAGLKAGLAQPYAWANADTVLHMRNSALQRLYVTDVVYGNSGWPHPDHATGAAAIARLVNPRPPAARSFVSLPGR